LQKKVHPEGLHISKDSTLVIKGARITIKDLDLDGAMVVEAGPKATLVLEGAKVKNRGWAWQPVKEGPGKRPPSEEEAIRWAFFHAPPWLLSSAGSPVRLGCNAPAKQLW